MGNEVMKERPILFNSAMVLAILDGRKTQTRRVVKCQPPPGVNAIDLVEGLYWIGRNADKSPCHWGSTCPSGIPGDRLWVRESMRRDDEMIQEYGPSITYVADDLNIPMSNWPWKNKVLPSRYMPKGLSRITLEITAVRVERVQDIGEADCSAEGILIPVCNGKFYANALSPCLDQGPFIAAFAHLWDSINGKSGQGWKVNPWVWVVEFKPDDRS